MSVRIEILDYKYGEFEGVQMISNPSFTSSSNWDLGTGWAISGGSANHSGASAGYLKQLNQNFVQGQTYRIQYKISGRTTGSLVLANHLAGNANGFKKIIMVHLYMIGYKETIIMINLVFMEVLVLMVL